MLPTEAFTSWIITIMWMFSTMDSAFANHLQEYHPWVDMDEELISKWYPPVDVCMMKSHGSEYDRCMSLRKSKMDSVCETTSQCMFTPRSLYQRPPGYDTNIPPKKNKKLLDMIIHLNQTSKTVGSFCSCSGIIIL